MNAKCVLCGLLRTSHKHCSNFTTLEEARNHARFHFLQSKKVALQIDEDSVYDQCFPEKKPQLKHEGSNTKNQRRRSLLEVCRSLFGTQPKILHAKCNVCGFAVRVREPDTSLTAHYVVNHACLHLPEKLFRCYHCEGTFSHFGSVKNHLLFAHDIKKATETDFEDKSVKFHEEIICSMKRCFFESTGTIRSAKVSTTRKSLLQYCASRLGEQPNGPKVVCNLCGLGLNKMSGKWLNSNSLLGHACTHLKDAKLYKCKHCEHSFNGKCGVKYHLLHTHNIQLTDDAFEDQCEMYQEEIRTAISRCYSDQDHEVPTKENTTKIKGENLIRNRTGSTLGAERKLHCHRLVKQFMHVDGKIKCNVCSKSIIAKCADKLDSNIALDHSMTHLRKPLYRCNVCSKSCCTYSIMAHHLRKFHALPFLKNHQCFADDFQKDILTMLSKCYGVSADGH